MVLENAGSTSRFVACLTLKAGAKGKNPNRSKRRGKRDDREVVRTISRNS